MARLPEVLDLKTHFRVAEGAVKAVDGVFFAMMPQETLGLSGESGCGKSVTAHSLMRIVPQPGRIGGGEMRLHTGDRIVDLADPELRGVAPHPRQRDRLGAGAPAHYAACHFAPERALAGAPSR